MTEALTYRYDRAAPGWGRKMTRLGYAAAYDKLLAALPPPPRGGRVADVGCGSGALAAAFLRRHGVFHALTLIDPSQAMLTEASATLARAPRISMECGTLDQIGTQRFDTLLCAHVIEHCPAPEAALGHLFTALRPGGHIALVVSKPHLCTWALRRIWGHRAYTPREMSKALSTAGFSDSQSIAFTNGPPSRTSHGYIARKGPSHAHCYR